MQIVSASRTMANARFKVRPPQETKIPYRRQKIIDMARRWQECQDEKRRLEEERQRRRRQRAARFIPKDVRMVIAEVAERYGLTVADIISKDNVRAWAPARKEAIRAVKARFALSSVVMGRYFRRDHASILYSLRSDK